MFIYQFEFYNEVVNGKTPIKDIFVGLCYTLNSDDFDTLFDEFSNQLDENFESYEEGDDEERFIGRYKMPLQIFKRVQLATMILSLLAMGATFNEEVFSHSLDFILKKELCSTSLFLN